MQEKITKEMIEETLEIANQKLTMSLDTTISMTDESQRTMHEIIPDPDWESPYINIDNEDTLTKCLAILTEKEQDYLIKLMIEADGRTFEDLAKIRGVTKQSINSKYWRLIRKIQHGINWYMYNTTGVFCYVDHKEEEAYRAMTDELSKPPKREEDSKRKIGSKPKRFYPKKASPKLDAINALLDNGRWDCKEIQSETGFSLDYIRAAKEKWLKNLNSTEETRIL